MEPSPLISVCIPTYNGEKYLEECLDSVLSQSYRNIEIVIVDDCSKDTTVAIVEAYKTKDARIRLYKNEFNIGLVGNWNKCIEQAKGKWIKFVFQDDSILPECLEKMLLGATDGQSLVVCKRTFIIDAAVDAYTRNYYHQEVVTFEKLGISSELQFIQPGTISRFAVENICMNFIGEPTSIMFERSVVEKFGVFSGQLSQICDLEFCLRIATNYGLTYIPEPLTRFRIHALSTTSSNLSVKRYILSNIDPLILVRQMLYDERYSSFRKEISNKNMMKLEHFFAVRVYEAYRLAVLAGARSEELKEFNSMAETYPEILAFKDPGIITKVLYKLVKLRRKIRSLFK